MTPLTQLHRWPQPKALPDATKLATLGALVEKALCPRSEFLLSGPALHRLLASVLEGLRALSDAYEEATHPSLRATVRSARRLLACSDQEPGSTVDATEARLYRAATLLKGLLEVTVHLARLEGGSDH